MALTRAHNVVTAKELKEISGVPLYRMVNHHIHKLVQVISRRLFFFFFFFTLSHFEFVPMWQTARC